MQREWFEKDYYATLGVTQRSTDKEITKAYRKLARQFHPDTNPNNASAEDRFKEISAAYDVLGNDERRKEYDEVRRLGPSAYGAPDSNGSGSFRFDVGDMAGSGMGDLFGQMFGGRGGQRRGGPQRGADLEASLTLDFTDAVHGLTTTLHLTSETQCSTCLGSGSRPGTSPQRCSQCDGRGMVDDNQGVFAFSSPCPRCKGRGVMIEFPCATCSGSGVEMRAREVNVRIPAGVDDGQRIRLKGRGAPGRGSGSHGDLFVVCRVNPHPRFSREGAHLTIRLPITFSEAALGADIEIPTLGGSPVTLRLKPGTQSGSRHRVKGKGITTKKSHGDLIVTVDVVVPNKLTADQKSAVEQMAKSLSQSPRENLTNDANRS
ncbi:MAG: molecular chaperone DnaJ [Actinomycetota bacterium]